MHSGFANPRGALSPVCHYLTALTASPACPPQPKQQQKLLCIKENSLSTLITFLVLLKPVAKRNCGGEEWASHYYNYSCYTPVRTSLSQHSGNYPAVQALIDRVTDSPAGLELQENPATTSARGAGAAATLGWTPSARYRDVHGPGCQHWGFIPSEPFLLGTQDQHPELC